MKGEKKVSKKEIQEKLFALWKLWPQRYWKESGESLHVVTWQKKPYTAAQVTYEARSLLWSDYGFTKVQYPDKWDAQYGIGLAVRKALASIARQIVEEK